MEVMQDQLQKNGIRIDMTLLYVQDELQKNGIRIDITLLNIHVNRILGMYKAIYDEATSRLKAVDQLIDVFHENCFNTVARVMAYITLIRCMNLPQEEDVRKLVRVVVPSLKNIIRVDGITSLKNPPIAHEIFIRTPCSSIGYTPMDTT